MGQILARASPAGYGNGNKPPPRPPRGSTPEPVNPARPPTETRRGRHAPRLPVSTRVAAAPEVSLALRAAEAEREAEARQRRWGPGLPAFCHDQAEVETLGKRPQAPEACVGPRPGGMTVRFGRHGLDVPGARARNPRPARRSPPRGATCRSQPADSRKKRARSSSVPVTATNSLSASCLSAIFAPCAAQTAPVVAALPQPRCRVPPAGRRGPAQRRPPAGPAPRGASRKALRVGNSPAPRPLAASAQSRSPTARVWSGAENERRRGS